jgi:hypothetical protein
MKTKDVVITYQTLMTVFNSIEVFKRTWELVPAIKEIKDAAEYYELARQKIVQKYTVEGEEFGSTPGFQEELINLLETEIDFKVPLKFTQAEIENAKIKNSELINIYDHFIV